MEAVINKLLNEVTQSLVNYCQYTKEIGRLLDSNHTEETASRLQDLLNKRDEEINRYKTVNEECGKIIGESPSITESEEFLCWKSQKNKLLEIIKFEDDKNQSEITKVFEFYKSKVKEIQDGKKVNNAYHGAHPFEEGIFIDRRK